MEIINELIHKISELRYSNNQEGELIGNSGNNQENSLFGNNDTSKNSNINQLEDSNENNKVENALAKIMKEIYDDENINDSSINNQENQN